MRELFLTSFSGIQYGIWKDEILSVRDIHALHRIPLSPARIAGIMIDDGRTVTIADLSVCIGYEPTQRTEQGCILLMEEGDKVMGFVVSGELRTQSISPELVFPLPDYLKTKVFDSCAVHEDIAIPVINITELYSRVLKADDVLSVDSLRISFAQPQDISGMPRVRCFAAGGELFAVPAAGIEDQAVKPGPITPLPNTPRYVQGVTFRDGRLLPVIDLSLGIKSQSIAPDALMLIAEIGGAVFGLLIDSDAGSLSADKVLIEPAPLIAQTSWLKHVVVHSGELIPLIDLAMALSPSSGAADAKPVWQRYAPESGFPDNFFKHEVGVVEFSILGERYALPKQEVKDVFAFKPCRALPDVPPIVIGVAEHQGKILPVVDLAMMFGRRSLTTPAWRMMLVNNGDFRALVITETVFGERQLALEIHRAVPIHLPHNLMYGCYPDEQAVRIILNVEAISVHFEKSLITKFMPALSQQMRMSPTGVVYKFPAEGSGEEPQLSATVTSAENADSARADAESAPAIEPEPEPVNVDVAAATSASTQESPSTVNEFSDDATLEQEHVTPAEAVSGKTIAPGVAGFSEESADQEFIAAENKDFVTASSQAVPEFNRQAALEDAEFVEWEEDEAAVTPIAPEPEQIAVFHAAVSEKIIMPETNTAAEKTPEPAAPLHSAAVRQSSGDGNKARESVDRSKQSQDRVLKEPAKNVSSTATADSRPAEPNRAAASIKSSVPYRMSREVEQLAALSGREESTAGTWKRRIAYGAIAVVLVAVLFYFSGPSDQPVVENSMQGTEPAKIEPTMVQPEPPKVEAELPKEKAEQARIQAEQENVVREAKSEAEQDAKEKTRQTLVLSPLAKTQTEPPRPAEMSRPPLELDIPKNRPTDIDVYVVQEGDTLWSISERFTGNPFNYPRIAGENRIADPDLIFPEQRIRLIK